MKLKYLIFFLLGAVGLMYSKGEEKTSVKKIEINSGWQFKQSDKEEWLPATVPGTVHTDLLNNKLIPDPFYRNNEKDLQWIDKKDWEYQTILNVDEKTLSMQNVELIFNGLDTYADVYLNGEKILSADNMFREWKLDVKKYLKVGDNQLKIYFHSPVKIDVPKIAAMGYQLPAINDQSENGGLGDKKISIFARKAQYHYGWDWGPRFVTSGIWRPIYLRAYDSFVIENIQMVPNSITEQLANVVAHLEINSDINDNVVLKINADGKEYVSKNVRLYKGANKISAVFEITKPNLWMPNGLGTPYLYNVTASLNHLDKAFDSIDEKMGLRTVEVVRDKDEKGTSFYFKVNGHPVFMKGANYIPQDNFLTRVTDKDYEAVIKSAVDANMNMLRVWGGGIYENDIFYDLCDKNGIMVWQDFMFACSMYPGDEKFLNSVKEEAIDNVKRLRNHPSIAIWCGNNENEDGWNYWGYKTPFTEEQQKTIYNSYKEKFFNIIPSVVKEYDGTRFYWPSSPNSDFGRASNMSSGDLHYWGVWHGKEPFENFQEKIGRFISEYGFQSFPEFKTVKSYTIPEDWDIESDVMMSHQRSGIGNLRIRDYLNMYYKTPKDFETFLYVGQVLQGYGIKQAIEAHRRAMPYNMGSLYWQINDCWPVASWSSTDYYKRWKAMHYEAMKAYKEIIVSPILKDGFVTFTIVSDRLEPVGAQLTIKSYDFSGKELYSQNLPIEIKANTSANYLTLLPKDLLNGVDESKVVVVTEIKIGGKVASDNLLYFKQPKDLALTKPEVKMNVKKSDNGYTVELSTDKLAKNVYLQIEEEGFFSDNYFDLLPGRNVVINFTSEKPVENLQSKIKLMTLTDSY
jgi:beta-mannosidase